MSASDVVFEPPTEDQYIYEVSSDNGATWSTAEGEPVPGFLYAVKQAGPTNEMG